MEEKLSPVGGVAYFGGGGGEEGTIDCRQWLEAVKNGTEPLVKPEEALGSNIRFWMRSISSAEGK